MIHLYGEESMESDSPGSKNGEGAILRCGLSCLSCLSLFVVVYRRLR